MVSKKIWAVLLSVLMIAGLLPTMAFAATSGNAIKSVSFPGFVQPVEYQSVEEYISSFLATVPENSDYTVSAADVDVRMNLYPSMVGHFASLGMFGPSDKDDYTIEIRLTPKSGKVFYEVYLDELRESLKSVPNYASCKVDAAGSSALIITSKGMKTKAASGDSSQPHALKVSGGSAYYSNGEKIPSGWMGYICPGAEITLKADSPAFGEEFTEWTASAGALKNASASETVFTMPGKAAEVTGGFQFTVTPFQPEHTIRVYGGHACSDLAGTVKITSAEPGTTVYLFADPTETGVEFDSWDAGKLTLNTESLPVSFTMPDTGDVQITAKTIDRRIPTVSLRLGNSSLSPCLERETAVCDLKYSSDSASGAYISVVGWQKYNEASKEWSGYTSNTFVSGKYRFRIKLTPNELGKCFTEATEVTVNGVAKTLEPIDKTSDGIFTAAYLDAEFEVATKPITSVTVSGFEYPLLDTAAYSVDHIQIPSDQGYHVCWDAYQGKDTLYSYWSESAMLKATDTFESGKFYYQVVVLEANPEYYFADNCTFQALGIDNTTEWEIQSTSVEQGRQAYLAGIKVPCKEELSDYHRVKVIDSTDTIQNWVVPYAKKGDTVEISAPKVPGMLFKEYEIKSGSVSLEPNGPAPNYYTSFTMPDEDVEILVNFTEHTHEWEYTASGNTINATCKSDPSCGSYSMIFNVVSGKAGTGELNEAHISIQQNEISAVTGKELTTVECTPKGSSTYTTGLPSAAGDYTARITFTGLESENVYAYSDFTVTGAVEYAISVTDGTASAGSTDVTAAAKNTLITVKADAAPDGMSFDRWVVDSGSVTLADASSASTTFEMPPEDVDLRATYKHAVHTWTYSANANVITARCSCGQVYTLTLTPTVSEFWDGPCVVSYIDLISDVTGVKPSEMEYAVKGTSAYSTTEPKEVGEYTARMSLGGATAYADLTITKYKNVLTVTAGSQTWPYDSLEHSCGSYTVTFGSETYTVDAGKSATLSNGDIVTATIIKTVKDVSDTAAGNNAVTTLVVSNEGHYNIETVAGKLTITPVPLTITADSSSKVFDNTPLTDDGWEDTAPSGLIAGDTIESVVVTGTITNIGTVPNVPSGAVIKREGKDITSNYTITYTNGTLEITKGATQYLVTLETNGGTIAAGKEVTYYYKDEGAALPAAANITKTGYTFLGWFDNPALSGTAVTAVSSADTGDKTYYAKWEEKTVTFTYGTNDPVKGTVSVSSETIGAVTGTPAGSTAAANEGFVFVNWTDKDDQVVGTDAAFQPAKAEGLYSENQYTANFTEASYAITVTNGKAAAGTDSVTEAKQGTEIVLTADSAPAGQMFDRWEVISGSVTLDKEDAETATFTMPGEPVSIQALYKELPWVYTPTYTVTAGTAEHGTIRVSARNAESGTRITVTPAPDKGYTLETLTVTDRNGREVPLSEANEGKYTFTMPAADVTVQATFMEDNTILNFFVDVPLDSWFYDAVYWAAVNGITDGTDAEHFSPNLNCTRAQVITFLWRAAGCPVVNYAMPFTDLEKESYYEEAVRWAASIGITSGTSETTFSPDMEITREQLAVLIYNYAKTKGEGFADDWMFLLSFDDADRISSWADEAMHWCVMKGIIQGVGDNLLAPKNTATRAQVVTMMYRFCA